MTTDSTINSPLEKSTPQSSKQTIFGKFTHHLRALSHLGIFFLKVFPMLPSGFINLITKPPVLEKVKYPTCSGFAEGDLYRPSSSGPHPGIVVCLGVVPFGVDHPQVPRLGEALARAGFAALLYWSPSMRKFELNPEDVQNIALAYDWLIGQPKIDPARSGLLGTCVGGSFALMAAAEPLIRSRIGYLTAYAPYSSIDTFARDIVTSSVSDADGIKPWKVDQLTRKVFVYSLTADLEAAESEQIRDGFAVSGDEYTGNVKSTHGVALLDLLTESDRDNAEARLQHLPSDLQVKLQSLSPINYLNNLEVPLIVLLHDQGDQVVPVGESRRLNITLKGHTDIRYTEMLFQHLDPAKGKLPFFRLIREFTKFVSAMYPLFYRAA